MIIIDRLRYHPLWFGRQLIMSINYVNDATNGREKRQKLETTDIIQSYTHFNNCSSTTINIVKN